MSKEFIFVPYEQVGELKFGMKRSEISGICGEYETSCMYGYPVEDRYLDNYGYMHTLCNNKELLEAVELLPITSSEDICLNYQGNIIKVTPDKDDLLECLDSLTDDLVEDEDGEGFSSLKLGIKIYCPEDEVEDVLIHDKHCFDEEQEYIENNGL